MSEINLFNTQTEISIRLLTIISHSKKSLNLQELIYYDYLTLYYGDVDSNYNNLHPSNPHHSIEYILKRTLINESLKLLLSKGLIEVLVTSDGINYKANSFTINFLSCFESNYFELLKKNSVLVTEHFNTYSITELTSYFNQNIGKWKGEFETEVLFRGKYNE